MRLIDADAFKEYIKDGIDGLILPKDQAVKVIAISKSFLKDIDEQPTMESKPQWIPCSERLPEHDGYYLVTTDGSHNDVIDIAEYGSFIRKGLNGDLYTVKEWNKASKILAWMPLPDPYEVKNNDT